MNPESAPSTSVLPRALSEFPTTPDRSAESGPARHRWRRRAKASLGFLLGAWCTQSLLGAVFVFGWLQRRTQRAAWQYWWKHGPRREPDFATSDALGDAGQELGVGPHGCQASGGAGATGGGKATGRKVLGTGLIYLRLGFQGLLNVSALTLPAGVLWSLSWWGGWQNSFHKGYEEAYVGPLVGVLGIFLFVAAMVYVPLALARQAVTGQWRAFWQWRTVTVLLRRSWIPNAFIALLFCGLNFGAMALKTGPYFVPQVKTLAKATVEEAPGTRGSGVDWNELTEAEALAFLNRYYLFSGGYLFAALILLRTAMARVYAGAVLRAVQGGALGEEELAESEWRILHRLELLQRRPAPPQSRWIRLARWAATRSAAVVGAVATGSLWLAFVAQIYVSEFLNYHPVVGWLNQPLVQLPWFRYVPAGLESRAGEIVFTMLALGCVIVSFLRRRDGSSLKT